MVDRTPPGACCLCKTKKLWDICNQPPLPFILGKEKTQALWLTLPNHSFKWSCWSVLHSEVLPLIISLCSEEQIIHSPLPLTHGIWSFRETIMFYSCLLVWCAWFYLDVLHSYLFILLHSLTESLSAAQRNCGRLEGRRRRELIWFISEPLPELTSFGFL